MPELELEDLWAYEDLSSCENSEEFTQPLLNHARAIDKRTNYRTWKSRFKHANTGAGQATGLVDKAVNATGLATTFNVFPALSASASIGLAPIVAITGPVGLALSAIDTGFNVRSAHKTQHHLRMLNMFLHNASAYDPIEGSYESLEYVISRKNKKLLSKSCACIPVAGSAANSAYRGFRTAKKRFNGNRGVIRREHAETLWENQIIGCRLATQVCIEVLGEATYEKIKEMSDGHLVLKKKLRSM